MLRGSLRHIVRAAARRGAPLLASIAPAAGPALAIGAARRLSSISGELTKDTPVWVEAYGDYVPLSDLANVELDRQKNVYRLNLFDPNALEDLRYELETRGIRVLQQAQDVLEESCSVFLREGSVSWKKRGKFRRQWEINREDELDELDELE